MGWDRFNSELKTQKAIKLRKAGVDYEQIAKELGYADRSGAWRAVNRGMRRLTTRIADDYQQTALAELNMVYESLWPAANRGSTFAIDRLLKISDQRLKLAGLYQKCDCGMYRRHLD